MKPFELSGPASELKLNNLTADTLRSVGPRLETNDIFGVVQQWMTEGIPYVFSGTPLFYEIIRGWLADRIGLHPKEITLIGSGRLGYSFDPSSFGKSFGEHSDLDFTAISHNLFDECIKSFKHWERDYRWGRVKPKNKTEENYWKQNIERLPNNIRRGFIAPHLIPNRYDGPKQIRQSLFLLHEKLNATPSAPRVRKVSIRVYADWRAFVKQMQINFSHTMLQL
jgi:hypothetical protein